MTDITTQQALMAQVNRLSVLLDNLQVAYNATMNNLIDAYAENDSLYAQIDFLMMEVDKHVHAA